MDAATILELKPALTTFLHAFDGCFGRRTTRRYLDLYVAGQLSELDRKRVEPMADALPLCPLRTATRRRVSLRLPGGRCSRRTAASLAAQLAVTQQRNVAAACSHRKRALRR